jgi:hypothetical protein
MLFFIKQDFSALIISGVRHISSLMEGRLLGALWKGRRKEESVSTLGGVSVSRATQEEDNIAEPLQAAALCSFREGGKGLGEMGWQKTEEETFLLLSARLHLAIISAVPLVPQRACVPFHNIFSVALAPPWHAPIIIKYRELASALPETGFWS